MTLYVENHTIVIHTDSNFYEIKFEYDADGEPSNTGAVIIYEKTSMASPDTEQIPDCPMMTEEAWILIRKAVDNMFNTHRYNHL